MCRRLLLHLLAAISLVVTGLGHANTTTTAAYTYDYDHVAAFAQHAYSNALRLAGSRAGLGATPRAFAAVRFPKLAGVAAEEGAEAETVFSGHGGIEASAGLERSEAVTVAADRIGVRRILGRRCRRRLAGSGLMDRLSWYRPRP